MERPTVAAILCLIPAYAAAQTDTGPGRESENRDHVRIGHDTPQNPARRHVGDAQ
jgi:hypothetical protein